MLKKLIATALLGTLILVGALAYSYLKTPAEASGPIQAIPIGQESIVPPASTPPAKPDEVVAAIASAAASPATATVEQPQAADEDETAVRAAPSPTTDEDEGAAEAEAEPAAPVEEPAVETAPPSEPTPAAEAKEPIIFEIQQEGSQARYVIDEVLRGVPTTVVGSTNQVAGQIAVDPANRIAQVGTILINARTFVTDESRRDNAVQNRILLTDQYEYITFAPTAIAGLPDSASVGESYTLQVTGDLTIRDVTRPVTFDVTVTALSESQLEGSARATIRYADWGISIPQVPFVASVSDEVQLELDFVAGAI